MKPRLNLATAPLENQRRFLAVAFGVGLPALVIFGLLTGAAYRDWRSTRERRTEVARLESDLRDFQNRRADLEKSFATPESKRVMERAAFLNGLIEQRSFPWTRMFQDLERELPTGVHVVSLAPRMQGGVVEVHMVVGAANDRGKLEFLRTLENSSEFTSLVVVSESRPSQQEDPTDTVKVELVAQYSAAEEKRAAAPKSGEAPSEKPAGLPRAKWTQKPASKAVAKIADNQRASKPGAKPGDKPGDKRGDQK